MAQPGQPSLRRMLQRALGPGPARLAWAPGRVNLIGEHTDYNGLPVFPMALTRGIALGFRPRADGDIVLRNRDPRYPPVRFRAEEHIAPEPPGAWGNYARAATEVLVREVGPLRGLEGVIGADLLPAAGLGSSSSLVVAVALALLDANGIRPNRQRLMELLARGERYVGVQGGGMDQAVCLGARAGHALRLDFRPALVPTAVRLPAGWRFVVAWSGVEAAKAAGARAAYNDRVRECRAALTRFAALRLPGEAVADYADLLGRLPAEEALARAPEALEGVLLHRFRHVVSEAERVNRAVDAMVAGDLGSFGALMNQSHASLRDDFGVSAPELDALVEHGRAAGAAGARLTGAGFGGCAVFLADDRRAVEVRSALAVDAPPGGEPFRAEPGGPAGVHPLEGTC
jgi:galactokinase